MAWPVTINCSDCPYQRELQEGEGAKEFMHFCPECGHRTKVKMEYETPQQTKSDKI